jgi:CheY-like chemotaxis protein
MQTSRAHESAHRVLIVDDSVAIQAIIRRALEAPELGSIDVQTASDGAEALDKLDDFKPDLVLTDWHMPGVGGLELLQTLRQMGHHELPVGFITTESGKDSLAQAQSSGAAFVLSKPFDPQALQRVVANSLPRMKAPTSAADAANEEAASARSAATHRKNEVRGPEAFVSLARVQQLTFAHLGTRSVDLTRLPGEGLPSFALKAPQLIALYASPGRKGAYALGMLDAAACCLIGGQSIGLRASEIQAMVLGDRPSNACVETATRFMRVIADAMVRHDASDSPVLNTARLTSQPFEKLHTLLLNNRGRSDLHVRIPGIAEGHMSFVLV